jgi:hypothetical protein
LPVFSRCRRQSSAVWAHFAVAMRFDSEIATDTGGSRSSFSGDRSLSRRFGDVSCSGLPSPGRFRLKGVETAPGLCFVIAWGLSFDFASLLKVFRVLLKVSVANDNFCASVGSGRHVSGAVKTTTLAVPRDFAGFARFGAALAESLSAVFAEATASCGIFEEGFGPGLIGTSVPSKARSSFNVKAVVVVGDLVSSFTASASEAAGVDAIAMPESKAHQISDCAWPSSHLHVDFVTRRTKQSSRIGEQLGRAGKFPHPHCKSQLSTSLSRALSTWRPLRPRMY